MLIKFSDDLILSEWITAPIESTTNRNHYREFDKRFAIGFLCDSYVREFVLWSWGGDKNHLAHLLKEEYIKLYIESQWIDFANLDSAKRHLDKFLIKMSKMKAFI